MVVSVALREMVAERVALRAGWRVVPTDAVRVVEIDPGRAGVMALRVLVRTDGVVDVRD